MNFSSLISLSFAASMLMPRSIREDFCRSSVAIFPSVAGVACVVQAGGAAWRRRRERDAARRVFLNSSTSDGDCVLWVWLWLVVEAGERVALWS